MRHLLCLICVFFGTAPVAVAHPHVFIDAGLRFVTGSDGRITGVEVTWTYDAFHNLLLLEDRGLDADGDGKLTEAERAELIGFDLTDWPEWFEGALFLTQNDAPVRLGFPRALSLDMQDGQLVTRHARSVDPVEPDALVVRSYDPSYFAAIDLRGTLVLPEGCTPQIEEATPDDAMKDLALLIDNGPGTPVEDTELGIHFADTLVLQCAGS